MRIHLINLDRSADRLAEFKSVNQHLPDVERFPAIDGETLDATKLVQDGTMTPATAATYRRGAIGAALSHAALWTKAIDSNETVTVCEDDAIFSQQFETLARLVIGTLGGEWDFIAWGWNFNAPLLLDMLPGVSPCLALFDQQKLAANVSKFQTLPFAPQALRLLQFFGLPSYTVTPAGARKLRDACIPIREAKIYFPGLGRQLDNFGVDVMMNAVYPQIRAFAAFPPLVVTKNDPATSTIGDR